MRIARQITEFCSIWSTAKMLPTPLERAVGEYPSHYRERKETAVPDMASLLRAGVQLHRRPVVVLPRVAAPAPVPQPQADLVPSDRIARPKSLGPANLQQSKGKAWDCSPLQLIWDQSIRTIAEKRRPEYEYRPTRHRIWSREIAGRRRCGLGLPSTKKVAWNAHRPDVTKIEARYRTPELTPRPIPAPIAAEAIRPSAHLPHPKSLNTWDPVKPPELQVAPLKFIGPAFGISIPEPLPLR